MLAQSTYGQTVEFEGACMDIPEKPLDQSIARARRRLLPFLLFMYVVSVLDRANIGFAKQALQNSRGISEGVYALGAGLFFLTYALFEIPSNLIMHKVGAKIWLSRIMVTWGLISAATMFVTGQTSFCVLRLLLGAAEAGFFPGVILYLTYWFPQRYRGQILGLFYFGVPMSFILGSPLSGSLLDLPTTLGIEGWQWMFLVEGLLAVAGGIGAYWYLDDRPVSARWLPIQEKQALLTELALEESQRIIHGPSSSLTSLKDPKVLQFSLIYFLIQAGVYGVIFYLPTEVSSILGKKAGLEVGLISAIPWIFAVGATFWLARFADRFRAHRLLASTGLIVSGLAILAVPISGPAIALCALCFAASGYIAIQPLFWTFPTGYLPGASAAAGIAMINALGNLGGFVVPNIKVWTEAHFRSHQAGSVALAGITFLGALLIATMRNRKVGSALLESAP